MTLIKNNMNGTSDSVEYRKKAIEAEKAEKEQEEKTFKETVDSLTDSLEEFTDEFKGYKEAMTAYFKQEKKEPEYFDKEQNTKLLASVNNVLSLLQKFKQHPIDLSPITTIATDIKNQTTALINCISSLPKQNNQSGYEALMRQVLQIVESNSQAVSSLKQQTDLNPVLEKINSSIENNKPTGWEFDSRRTQKIGQILTTATPIFKK